MKGGLPAGYVAGDNRVEEQMSLVPAVAATCRVTLAFSMREQEGNRAREGKEGSSASGARFFLLATGSGEARAGQ